MRTEFNEERTAHKVNKDNARLAVQVLYTATKIANINNTNNNTNDSSNTNTKTTLVTFWKIVRIICSGDKMYSLAGTIVESAGMMRSHIMI
jgi:hypothetical protein